MPIISGSLTLISGSLEIPSGSLIGTASYATSAEQLSGVQTAIFNIDSGSILNMGSTPIELLPAPGANKYYDIEKVILEYTHVSTAYTLVGDYHYLEGLTGAAKAVHTPIITGAVNSFIKLDLVDSDTFVDGGVYRYQMAGQINAGIFLSSWNNIDPTDGDGTLRAIITYTTRTFGS